MDPILEAALLAMAKAFLESETGQRLIRQGEDAVVHHLLGRIEEPLRRIVGEASVEPSAKVDSSSGPSAPVVLDQRAPESIGP